ncbi:ABC transporter ATP-binding protein [Virgibacillus necropolis]|uniref:ABC transporter n=1 Tax=Virgibacillus necropolis TaxID=163877 RepID=A0A221MHJ2_9BACI|nr:ABC transporter ATP-binding protein [Virgibacillus necropolis]ASN07101.1 ABC transporter [Virgibacillus necropolis]
MKTLEVNMVSVEIGKNRLLDAISFELEPGQITALVGHNGAGKSTLMKAILGIVDKSSGKITINKTYDFDNQFLDFKQLISYLPEEPLLLTELTVMQNFQLYGMSYGIAEEDLSKRVDHYVRNFELNDKLNEYPESLSKGMRQKVQTICALLPDTPVMLIDEPYMGLDVYAVDFFEEVMKEKASNGTSILLTTHQLDRVKHFADGYIMLQRGEMLNKGPIGDFHTIQRRSKE